MFGVICDHKFCMFIFEHELALRLLTVREDRESAVISYRTFQYVEQIISFSGKKGNIFPHYVVA